MTPAGTCLGVCVSEIYHLDLSGQMCPSLNLPLLLYFTQVDSGQPSVFSEPNKKRLTTISMVVLGGGALNTPALVEGCFPVNTRVCDTHGVSKVKHPPTFRFPFCPNEGALKRGQLRQRAIPTDRRAGKWLLETSQPVSQ